MMPGWVRRQASTLLMAVLAAALAPAILGNPVWLDNAILIAIFAMLALSVGMSYGHAGILSVATGAFAALGAFATSIATTRYNASPYLGLVIALVLPMLLAYPLARVVTRLSPLPLSIATLVLGSIVEIVIREGGDFTGGYIGISGIPPIPLAPTPGAMYALAWTTVVIGLFLYCNLRHSAFGRAVATARQDALRAAADGVNVSRSLAAFFALSAAYAGAGGWLYAHNLSYVGPDSLNSTTSITVLLMAIVGGVSEPLGPVIGAALLLIIVNYLPAAESQGMVYGAALILILLGAPRGILGTDWRRLARGRSASGPGTAAARERPSAETAHVGEAK